MIIGFMLFLIAGAILISPFLAEDNIVIARRGASGYLPEHTFQAYATAYGMDANYVEPDLVLTWDKVFICLHDIHLDLNTNVKEVFQPGTRTSRGSWTSYASSTAWMGSSRISRIRWGSFSI